MPLQIFLKILQDFEMENLYCRTILKLYRPTVFRRCLSTARHLQSINPRAWRNSDKNPSLSYGQPTHHSHPEFFSNNLEVIFQTICVVFILGPDWLTVLITLKMVNWPVDR